MRLSSPLLLLWAFPFRGQAEEGLASTEIKTGFYVVFEHMTATDCIPNQHACHAQQHEIWQTDKGEQGSAAAHTYPTVIPQICPTGWENVTYIITDTAAATETAPSWGNSGKPPPGFTVMTTECRVCGPTPTVVTVTVPHRGSRVPPKPEKSVISCTGGSYVPGIPPRPVPQATSWSPPHGSGTATSTIGHSPTIPSSSSYPITSSTVESSVSDAPTSTVESTAGSSSVSSGTLPSVASSSTSGSSIQPSSSAASPSSTALPVQTPACVPSFDLVGVSENSFNPSLASFTLELSCGTLDADNYTVLANWVPVVGTTSTASSIGLDSLDGYNLLTVAAFEVSGYPIFQTFSLLFGSAPLSVLVVDELGNPSVAATVYANASTYPNIGAVATTDAQGIAVFDNVPGTTISLRAVGPDSSLGVGSLAGGLVGSTTIQLQAFHAPAQGGSDGFDVNNGLSGWTGGSTVDDGLAKRALTLVVATANQPNVQVARKSFSLGDDATSVFIEYQFQTDEVPGGWFGSQYNDYYSVSVRTDSGGSVFASRSMNELGLGAFDFATGETDWLSTTLDIPTEASAVEFTVAVSNVGDSALQSKVTVRRVGLCDRCATCDDCPELAKCQSSCKTPALNSCVFYRSCAEETLRCGPSGFPLARGERTCNRFQNLLGIFSSEGQLFVPKAEQCMQQALADRLSCDLTCESAEATGLGSLPNCFASSGFCSLKGIDYARILSIFDDEDYKTHIRKAAASEVDCVERIFDAIDADIVEKIADAAAGNNVAQNVADVLAMAAARVFFLYVPKNTYLSAEDAVKHVQQVYDTAVALGEESANERVMDYYRYPDYNDFYWIPLVGVVNPVWIELARQHGVVPFVGFVDPAGPQINVGFSHLFASMIGVYFHGDRSSISDITGWLGDLYQLYGGTPSGSTPAAFCQTHFGTNLDSGFKAEDLRQDADAFNIGRSVRGGASVAAAFRTVMEGGYATRFSRFFSGRFDGSAQVAIDECVHYMTTITDPLAVAARKRFAGFLLPPDTAIVDGFCTCFGNRLAEFAAAG